HLRYAAEHALPDTGDEPTDLDVGVVDDARAAAFDVGQRDHRVAAHEARAPAALDGEAIRIGRLLVGETDLALERSLDRSHADLHDRPELVVAESFELLATGNRLPQALGIEKRLPDFLPGRGNVVSTFDLHRLDLLYRACEMKGDLVYQGTRYVALALQPQTSANTAINRRDRNEKVAQRSFLLPWARR